MKKPFYYCILAIASIFVLSGYNVYSQTIITSNTNWSAITPTPTASDAIEIYSGATLTVDVSNAVCLSLIVGGGSSGTANLRFSGTNPQLTVSGSVSVGSTASPGKFAGDITFISGSTLIANSLTLVSNNFNVSQIIMTAGGTLKTGSLNTAAVGGGEPVVWTPGTGTVELTATNTLPTTVFTAFNNLTISGGTTTLNSDIALTGDWSYSSTSNSIGGTGNVSLAGNFTNTNASLDVQNTGFTFNGTSDQTISSASSPADVLSTFGTLTIDNPGTVTMLTDVGAETSFTLTQGTLDLNTNKLYVNGVEYTGPLPVELVSFSARISDTEIILNWLTATEVNNYGFEVQRSVKADNWEVLGFVEGHGNSNSPKEYNFIDSEINSAGTYSYRLKQIDNDGTYEFSKAIEVNFGSPIKFELSQNYPNPFNPSTTISFNLPKSGVVTLTVYNLMGEEIQILVEGYREAGIYTVNFNAEGLASGMYLYRLSTNGFTESKKMLIMK